MALVLAFASTAAAQLSDYLGPGVSTGGASQIGMRSGQPVDLRFYADVSGVYDTGLQPVSVDSKGNLVQVNGLYGEELTFGAYGSHQWQHSQLGVDYRGAFRNYSGNSYYDGIDQQLALGYTLQKSRRLYFGFSGVGGTLSRTIGALTGYYYLPVQSMVDQPSSSLFDNRIYFADGEADMTYLLSARTSFTVSGQGFIARRQSDSLSGVIGYIARGSLQRRMSRATTLGVIYDHMHFGYTQAFGNSDVNTYQAFLGAQLGRRWTGYIEAGAFQAEAQGLQEVSVDPAIAALLGVTTTTEAFYSKHTFPTGSATVTRSFKTASLSASYAKTVTPGNGVYLASRQEVAAVTYSYTAVRKLNFSFFAGATRFNSLGQSLQPYWQANGGAGVSYTLSRSLHLTARYDARRQEIQSSGYNPISYRATIGLAFSPGSVPLSLWQ